jgi:hypothetical protein
VAHCRKGILGFVQLFADFLILVYGYDLLFASLFSGTGKGF